MNTSIFSHTSRKGLRSPLWDIKSTFKYGRIGRSFFFTMEWIIIFISTSMFNNALYRPSIAIWILIYDIEQMYALRSVLLRTPIESTLNVRELIPASDSSLFLMTLRTAEPNIDSITITSPFVKPSEFDWCFQKPHLYYVQVELRLLPDFLFLILSIVFWISFFKDTCIGF